MSSLFELHVHGGGNPAVNKPLQFADAPVGGGTGGMATGLSGSGIQGTPPGQMGSGPAANTTPSSTGQNPQGHEAAAPPANFNLLPNAPNMATNVYGQAYGADQAGAGVGGTDSGNEAGTNAMLANMAAGGGPNPALAAEKQGIAQGQQLAAAQAGSGRGQFGQANAAHDAMATGANAATQGAQQGSVLVQQQQQNAVQNLMQNQQQQRAQDLIATGMDAQAAYQQASLEQSQNQSNQTQTGNIINDGMQFLKNIF